MLEIACGTGILTRRLRAALPKDAELVATDLNPAMLDRARETLAGADVHWRTADAAALPFKDATFDAVVCQFGYMFLPDRATGFAEARRVLALRRHASDQRVGAARREPRRRDRSRDRRPPVREQPASVLARALRLAPGRDDALAGAGRRLRQRQPSRAWRSREGPRRPGTSRRGSRRERRSRWSSWSAAPISTPRRRRFTRPWRPTAAPPSVHRSRPTCWSHRRLLR